MAKRLTYSEALAKDRARYLRERNLLGKALRNALSLLERGVTNDNFSRGMAQLLETIFDE